MKAMILTPEQARAVVGCARCEMTGVEADAVDFACRLCQGDAIPSARFIPADPSDAWPVGEWVEVRAEVDDCPGCNTKTQPHISGLVGRVRLGDPVPVEPESNNCPSGPHLVRGARSLGRCTSSGVEPLTHPHLDLWPDAFTPGSYAQPIIERSTT